ncbi:MAG: glycosyl hydrolase 108 family protein, partial [Hyphomicrobium sp.]
MTSMNLTDLHKVRADWLRVQGDVAYCNDPYDPGGPTNKGITVSDFAKWRGVTVTAQSRGSLIEQLKDIADDTVSYRPTYHLTCGTQGYEDSVLMRPVSLTRRLQAC